MKETIKINLNQRLFDLDADAFERLKEYLDSLKRYFQKTSEEAEEILQDIEQRIAEILEDKLGTAKQVVTLSDIEEVIQMMGTADDFARETEMSEDNEHEQEARDPGENASAFNRQHRKLYRDLDNNIIGGVCSGIASYFNVDPVWIRLAFIILLFFDGIGFLAYLVMWIAIPVARTTSQKLQMKGQPVTIENIQQSVKKEFIKVKDNLNNLSKSESYKKAQHAAAETLSVIGNVLLVTLKVVLVIFGVALAIAGIAFIIALITSLFSGGVFFDWHIPHLPINEYIIPLVNNFSLMGLALSLVLLIPVVALFIGILKLIFGVKSHTPVLSAFAWTFWVLALVFVIASVASGNKLISYSYKQNDYKTINISSKSTLYIGLGRDKWKNRGIEYYSFFGREILHSNYDEVCYIHPRLEIQSFENDKPEIGMEYTAVIPRFNDDYDENIEYNWVLNDTILLLDEYFSIDEDCIWQMPGMKIILSVPEQQKIVLNADINAVFGREENNISEDLQYGTILIMKEGNLVPLEN
jgi:phage shock protein PspC (stress-responsive transcriptional regulator)